MPKKYLITGGCGFIGTSLIRNILQNDKNAHIRVLDNLTTGKPEDLREITPFTTADTSLEPTTPGVFLIKGDIRDLRTVLACTKGMDCIVHLAANTGVQPSVENPINDMQCNVIGTVNMLEGARLNSVKKFIFASSGAPAGEVEPPIHEELPPHPVSPYGASKLAGEGYCSAYYRTFGVETVCLRFGNVYGPGSGKKSSVVAKFIRKALSGKTCKIYGDGGQTRDFVYIGDLIDAMMKSMTTSKAAGETFQIASGKERTVSEITEIISSALKDKGVGMKVEYESSRLGDVRRNYSDTSKADRILSWQPSMEINKGVNLTVDYFIKTQPQDSN
jgi:UDP-glucose 4-epimerase